jgi:hypothetical protein
MLVMMRLMLNTVRRIRPFTQAGTSSDEIVSLRVARAAFTGTPTCTSCALENVLEFGVTDWKI